MSATVLDTLQRTVGSTDIYLLDQILKGRLAPGQRVLDAGAGGGRNLRWPLLAGCDVWAVDRKPERLQGVRDLATELGVALPEERLQSASLPELPFEAAAFDVVLCIAVLHFAPDHDAFEAMVQELWRVTAPGGLLFMRLASDVGLQDKIERDARGWAHLPDGSDRYLVTEAQLQQTTERLGARLADPLKTVVVHGMRSMTTWCLQKEMTSP